MNRILLILLVSSVFGLGQEVTNSPPCTNILVLFKPDNQPYIGVTNYPAATETVCFQANIDGWSTNMTLDQFTEFMSVIQDSSAWRIGKSNANYLAQSKTTANLARIVELYQQIPAGRAMATNTSATLRIIEGSLASGTNTQAQVVNRIRQLNGAVNDVNTIQAAILELLQRLGPELRKLYEPAKDDTQ